MEGFAGPFEPGIGPKEHFKHGGDQRFGLFLLAIGLLVQRRIVGERRSEIGSTETVMRTGVRSGSLSSRSVITVLLVEGRGE